MTKKRKSTSKSNQNVLTSEWLKSITIPHFPCLPCEIPSRRFVFEALPMRLQRRYLSATNYSMFLPRPKEFRPWYPGKWESWHPLVRFESVWGDYVLACENWAFVYFSNRDAIENYFYVPGEEWRMVPFNLKWEIPPMKREVDKAAKPITEYLFWGNEGWVLPEFAGPDEFETFAGWIESAILVHQEMRKRIKNAWNKRAMDEKAGVQLQPAETEQKDSKLWLRPSTIAAFIADDEEGAHSLRERWWAGHKVFDIIPRRKCSLDKRTNCVDAHAFVKLAHEKKYIEDDECELVLEKFKDVKSEPCEGLPFTPRKSPKSG